MDYAIDYALADSRDYIIHKGHSKIGMEPVIIKEYKAHVPEDKIANERKLLQEFQSNQYVLRFFGHCQQAKIHFCVFEYAEFSLEQYSSHKFFTDKETVDIANHIFAGLRTLHNSSIYLLNLRMDNIWVTVDKERKCSFKFIDFLDAVQGEEAKLCAIEPDDFTAPEISQDQYWTYVSKADIYSLGQIIVHLKIKVSRISEIHEKQEEAYKIEFEKMHDELRRILEMCLKDEAADRGNLFNIGEVFKCYYASAIR